MSPPDTDSTPEAAAPQVSGVAATMTILATGLGCAVAGADPTILCSNIAAVRTGLHLSRSTGSFVASLATLAGATTVLGAGVLGDLYGKKRMYLYGLLGAIGFDVMAATAPNGLVLLAARAGVGVAFAFLFGLSLAIVNAVFPPQRRKNAIALYLATYFAAAAPLPAVGTWLVQQVGWRACFLVTPAVAVISLLIAGRYVPETARAARRLDGAGLLLVAVALLGVVYGISRLQVGFHVGAVAPILVGLLAAAGFVFRELHTPNPALDLHVFRSGPFNAAILAGMTYNVVAGGSIVLVAFYLVTVCGQSPAIFGLLLIPTTVLQALAATGSGRAVTRFGDRATLVCGLIVLLVGLLAMTLLDENTSIWLLFLMVAIIAIGGAIVGTPQSTIVMAAVPADRGGAVSAAKAALNETGYSLGLALFPAIGTWLFIQDRNRKLAELKITLDQGREALRLTDGSAALPTHGERVLDSELARGVVQGAQECMVHMIHSLSLIMAVVPATAIVAALVLMPRKAATRSPKIRDTSSNETPAAVT